MRPGACAEEGRLGRARPELPIGLAAPARDRAICARVSHTDEDDGSPHT